VHIVIFRIIIYRQDAAKRRQPVFKFTVAKNQHFRPLGWLVASINVKFGTAEGHVGPLDRAKFQVSRCPKVGTRPPK